MSDAKMNRIRLYVTLMGLGIMWGAIDAVIEGAWLDRPPGLFVIPAGVMLLAAFAGALVELWLE